MRKFEKSTYEEEFTGKFNINYKGYDIYEYNSMDRKLYTFWVSSESYDYYSSMQSLEDCKQLIDRIIAKGN